DKLVLGHEFAGFVEDAGDESEWLSPGDRITVNPLVTCSHCQFCLAGNESSCQNTQFIGIDRDGCFAEFVRVPVSNVFKLPDNVSFLAAAYAEPVAAGLAVLKTAIEPSGRGLIYGQNRFAQLMLKILRIYGFNNV